MTDKVCKGLDATEQAIKDDKFDPDNLEIEIDGDVWAKISEGNADALKDFNSADNSIHNYRAWYDHTDHGKAFCVSCVNIDGKFGRCALYDTKGLSSADPVTVEGYGEMSFESYSFNAANNLYMAASAFALGATLMLQ